MPNWCENRVTVSGSTEDVKEFIELVRGGEQEGNFSFQSIKPMPTELEETKAPTPENTDQPEVDGHTNWYDWRLSNWGCKWDVGETNYYDADTDGYVEYEFYTPWGPPDRIVEILREKFPDLSISWFYHEPGCEIAGYL